MRVFSRFVDVLGLRAEFPVLRSAPTSTRAPTGRCPAAPCRPPRTSSSARPPTAARSRTSNAAASSTTRCARPTRARSAPTPADVALTTCTSEGMAQIVAGLELGPGDEILTSDEEHPGLLGALGAARDLRGVTIREVPLAERRRRRSAPSTRLVACSHVGWVSGLLAPAELARGRRAGAARRRAGRRRGAGRRARARLRRLRRRRAEVAVRPRRPGHAVGQRPSSASGSRSRAAATPTSRTPTTGSTRRLHEDARRFDATVAERRGGRVRAGRHRAAGVGRLGARCTSARARSPRAWPSGSPSAGARSRRATRRTLVSFASADPEAERDAAGRARL